MIFIKKVMGHDIKLEIELLQRYPNGGLYQVYKLKNGKRIPLYKESYTDLQIQNIVLNQYIVEEEVFEWDW